MWPIFAFLHTAHGFASSLFLGSFRPVYFFRTHFMSPWAIHSYHLGSMAFSCLLTLVCPCCWPFLLLGFVENEPQQTLTEKIWGKWKVGWFERKGLSPIERETKSDCEGERDWINLRKRLIMKDRPRWRWSSDKDQFAEIERLRLRYWDWDRFGGNRYSIVVLISF